MYSICIIHYLHDTLYKTRFLSFTLVETDMQSSWVHGVEEHKNLDEENAWREEQAIHVRETRPTLPARREEQTHKQVDDDWFIQLDVSSKKTGKGMDT